MMDTTPNHLALDEYLGYSYELHQPTITEHKHLGSFSYFSSLNPEKIWQQTYSKWSSGYIRCVLVLTSKRMLYFLLPSFLSGQIKTQGTNVQQRLRHTSWLNGLRGIASFFVFVYHYIYAYYPQHELGYDGVSHTNLLQLPILRLLYAGPAMVKIFFVISGFALTWKPMKLLKGSTSNSNQKLLKVLSSSILRRYPRLYLPILARSVLVALLVHTGACQWIDHARRLNHQVNILPGHYEYHPLNTRYIIEQMANMWREFSVYAFDNILYSPKRYIYYTDNHLWTIPVEFSQSINLFAIVLATASITQKIRSLVVLPMLYIMLTWCGKWELALFLSGAMIADVLVDVESSYDITIESLSSLQTSLSYTTLDRLEKTPLWRVFWILQGFLALFLISYPVANAVDAIGYKSLFHLTPRIYMDVDVKPYHNDYNLWQSYGASLLVLSTAFLPQIRWILDTSVFIYLGRISFALYLCHGPILRTLGYRTILIAWSMIEQDDNSAQMFVIIFAFLFLLMPITIWVSDIFTRAFDEPSVRCVKWIEMKIT